MDYDKQTDNNVSKAVSHQKQNKEDYDPDIVKEVIIYNSNNTVFSKLKTI